MLGEQTLLRFAWRTTSCLEEVSWPSIDMWPFWGDRFKVEKREEQKQGNGFSVHFLHHEMWLQNKTDNFGWLLKITRVWDWSRSSIFAEMGRVFKNEKRSVLILFRDCTSFNLMVKWRTFVGRTWNNWKHKSEIFCFASDWRRGEDTVVQCRHCRKCAFSYCREDNRGCMVLQQNMRSIIIRNEKKRKYGIIF